MGHVHYMAAVAGLSTSHVHEVESGWALDARRGAALPFARKLTRTPEKIGQADVDALRKVFSEDEVVQLVFAVCHFNTMNRLADAFGVPLEQGNVFGRGDDRKVYPVAPAGTGVKPPPPPAPPAKPEPKPEAEPEAKSPEAAPAEPTAVPAAAPAATSAKEPSASLASLLQRVGRGLEKAVPRVP